MRILFFGDSATYGQIDDEKCGWVHRLRLAYEQRPGDKQEFYNLGISGNMAANVVKRLALETESRRWYDEELAIVVAVGMNDSKFKGETYASTPELFAGELEQILSAARQYTTKILFVGINPVDESLTIPFAPSIAGSCYSNERIKEFETAISVFCAENSAAFVPLFQAMQDRLKEEQLLADGLHPNAAGHQFLAELIGPKLNELLA